MRRLGGHVWQRARGGAADARASGIVDRPSRRSPESSEGRDARRTDLVAWPGGLDVAGRGLARGQTLRKSMWVMVSLNTGLDVVPGSYLPLGLKVKLDGGRLVVGITCALCHATL